MRKVSHGSGSGKRRTFIAKRTAGAYQRVAHRCLAAVAAGFLPVAAYTLVHIEITPERRWLWALVGASLIYSAPSLAEWAEGWCRSKLKAWGFTVLLEGVLVASELQALSGTALVLLVAVNAAFAWHLAGANKNPAILSKLGGAKEGGVSDALTKE